ncbi:MAG: PilZ domain-containing protein [Calditrichae bacterium]|nr:PilZ domain-containing protein [Calditrichota bacterium]MCB9059750.1 PilZ domain-containing protein [Calditrichia bacterium]
MKKEEERRSFERVELPGVSVRYKVSKGLSVLKNYSQAETVINLSKSGIAFYMKQPANFGTPVEMKLSFPDGNDLLLKGKIRWKKNTNGSGNETTGVMFNPFGSKREYNSIKALEYLRAIKDQAINHPLKNSEED